MSFFSPNNNLPTLCGTTDFNGLFCKVVPVTGCTLLLCTEGCAIGTWHFQPVAIRRGMLVPLFTHSRFTIESVGNPFHPSKPFVDKPPLRVIKGEYRMPIKEIPKHG